MTVNALQLQDKIRFPGVKLAAILIPSSYEDLWSMAEALIDECSTLKRSWRYGLL